MQGVGLQNGPTDEQMCHSYQSP